MRSDVCPKASTAGWTAKIIFFVQYEEIPETRRKYFMYGRIVVDERPKKYGPYRTRLTVGGNLILDN